MNDYYRRLDSWTVLFVNASREMHRDLTSPFIGTESVALSVHLAHGATRRRCLSTVTVRQNNSITVVILPTIITSV